MRLYKVTYQNNCLYFIAEDKDHLITLISQLVGTIDYVSLLAEAEIEQVAGVTTLNDRAYFYESMPS